MVGSEEAGDAGGRGMPPDLKTSGGVAAGAGLGTGLGAGKQGSAIKMGHTGVSSHHNPWVAQMSSGRAHLGQVQIHGG